jgi:hypothetical protein
MNNAHSLPKPKKKHKKDTHRFPTNICATIMEWAERADMHPSSIRKLIKAGELRTIDNINPLLIHALDMKFCLEDKNASRKKDVRDDEIFCFTCREGRKPISDSIYLHRNKQNRPVIKGICSACEGKLYRITNDREAEETIKQLKTPPHRLHTLSHGTTKYGSDLYKKSDFVTHYLLPSLCALLPITNYSNLPLTLVKLLENKDFISNS